jgi:predicted NUDIX family NTP pyrophosphohydrolase
MVLGVPSDPNYWRNRAEEAWSIAEQMTDAHTKALMVGIAQTYEKITKWFDEGPWEFFGAL